MPAISISAPKTIVSGPFTDAQAGETLVILNVPRGGFIPAAGVSLLFTETLAGTVEAWPDGSETTTDAWVDLGSDGDNDALGGFSAGGVEVGASNIWYHEGGFYPDGGVLTVTLPAGLTSGRFYAVISLLDLSDIVQE